MVIIALLRNSDELLVPEKKRKEEWLPGKSCNREPRVERKVTLQPTTSHTSSYPPFFYLTIFNEKRAAPHFFLLVMVKQFLPWNVWIKQERISGAPPGRQIKRFYERKPGRPSFDPPPLQERLH